MARRAGRSASAASSWPAEGPPMMPEGYNSDLQIAQGEGYVTVVQEMIHDARIIPTDGRPHLCGQRSSVVRQFARPLGGRQAGGGDHQFHRPDPDPERPHHGQAEGDREVLPHGRQQRAVSIHGRRSRNVDQAVVRAKSPGPRSTVRFTNTPATKETTAWPTTSAARAPPRRRRREK